jgi:hypothetical protein
MPIQWFANDRSTEPPKINLISSEQRKVAVGLADAIGAGEAILSGTMDIQILNWRTMLPIVPDPLVGNLSYDDPTKTVAQEVDASLLPLREACAMVVSFDVSYGLGTERRSSYVILVVEI